eukprot:331044-Chlamydomonas_euryale.AAC.1
MAALAAARRRHPRWHGAGAGTAHARAVRAAGSPVVFCSSLPPPPGGTHIGECWAAEDAEVSSGPPSQTHATATTRGFGRFVLGLIRVESL